MRPGRGRAPRIGVDVTAAPAPPRELTIAVLGARDSAAPAVASALSAAAGTGLSAAAGPAADAEARIEDPGGREAGQEDPIG